MTDDGAIEGGWLVLSENIYQSPIFHANPELFRLWILILCLARRSQQPYRLMDGRTIGYGELITSIHNLRELLGREGNPQRGEPKAYVPSAPTTWRLLRQLESDGMIDLDTSRESGTRVSVRNYEKYQTFGNYGAVLNSRERSTSVQPKSPANTGASASGEQTDLGQAFNERSTSVQRVKRANDDTRDTKRPDIAPDGRNRPAQDDGLRFNYETGNWNRQPTPEEVAIWRAAYPGIDIKSEMNKATLWLRNHQNRKKKRFERFLANWFNTAQTRIDARLS